MNPNRTKTIIYSIYLTFFLVLVRLFYWQIIKSDEIKRQLILQLYKTDKIQAQNGNIFDSIGDQLTYDQPIFYLSLYKPNLKDIPTLINKIKIVKPDLKPSDLALLDKFSSQESNKWITLNSIFSLDEKEKLNSLNLSFTPGFKREYPYPDFAKYTISGLETYYQKQLQGRAGFSWSSKDAIGQTILTNKIWTSPPVNGRDLNITINPIIQNKIETILQEGVTKYSADKGSIIVMSSESGAILAMADYTSATPSATLNPMVADLYEPGSIIKPLILTMALNSHSVDSSFVCTGCSQPRVIGPFTITNWDKSVHPNSSIYDIITNSDNIGMSYIIDRLGLTNFLTYYHLLNFDRKTGIDLSGESRPILKSNWPDIDFATAAFGQGFAVTQIQMISAFNTLANN
ncbi:MAG: penicillin-binding transpeptidase domain-containing protein, partial [Candidatus Shapirobacteria bacterium]|nr:penicillin-binding transpeptidase domain-containing protein [Candidatus Shapirobacteria bacterium]